MLIEEHISGHVICGNNTFSVRIRKEMSNRNNVFATADQSKRICIIKLTIF